MEDEIHMKLIVRKKSGKNTNNSFGTAHNTIRKKMQETHKHYRCKVIYSLKLLHRYNLVILRQNISLWFQLCALEAIFYISY